jgi:hypothetical protein
MHDWELVTSKRFAAIFRGADLFGSGCATARTVKHGGRKARMMCLLRGKLDP